VTNFRRQVLIRAFKLFDPGILALSYLIAAVKIWHLTAFESIAAFISMRIKLLNGLLFLGLVYSWHIIFSAFGLYRSRRISEQGEELLEILKATSAATLVLGLVAVTFRVQMITLSFVALFWTMSTLFLSIGRLLMRELLARLRRHGRNLRHVLIVGTNPRAVEFARTIELRSELGYQLIGYADEEWIGNQDFEKNGQLIVTDLGHFSEFLRERIIDEVVIALPMKSFYSKAACIVGECQKQGVIVRALTNIFDYREGYVDPAEIGPTHIATYSTSLFEGWPLVFKRLLDLVASATLLVLLTPLFLLVAILVKFDSSGPAFFVQERVGLNKRKFQMYKFRTMNANAEGEQSSLEGQNEASGPVFKINNDPRITRLGKYLRKTSIDETPQLLNVLKGDMSIVGPRPLPIRDYQGFEQDWLRRRFSVRPGITCLWQIQGRSSVSFQEWMRLDLHYIDNWSFWLDVKVIAKTIPAVLKGVGAA
jgi:exopolysaccharide biosynthesis polyprenyl glycosylphosphotransferase